MVDRERKLKGGLDPLFSFAQKIRDRINYLVKTKCFIYKKGIKDK